MSAHHRVKSPLTITEMRTHPPHQRFDMPTADLAPLGSQQASQHLRRQIARKPPYRVNPDLYPFFD
jgi:hypothetical protein